jgi:hypothetical protein
MSACLTNDGLTCWFGSLVFVFGLIALCTSSHQSRCVAAAGCVTTIILVLLLVIIIIIIIGVANYNYNNNSNST